VRPSRIVWASLEGDLGSASLTSWGFAKDGLKIFISFDDLIIDSSVDLEGVELILTLSSDLNKS
jgi:hypothetical protein